MRGISPVARPFGNKGPLHRGPFPFSSTSRVRPFTAVTRTRSPTRPRGAARVPDLAAKAHPAARVALLDHLRRRSEQALRAGPHPVATQEADPEADLGDLDHDRHPHQCEAPAGRQHEQGERDRADQEHRGCYGGATSSCASCSASSWPTRLSACASSSSSSCTSSWWPAALAAPAASAWRPGSA